MGGPRDPSERGSGGGAMDATPPDFLLTVKNGGFIVETGPSGGWRLGIAHDALTISCPKGAKEEQHHDPDEPGPERAEGHHLHRVRRPEERARPADRCAEDRPLDLKKKSRSQWAQYPGAAPIAEPPRPFYYRR
jgi:hypothetical protein